MCYFLEDEYYSSSSRYCRASSHQPLAPQRDQFICLLPRLVNLHNYNFSNVLRVVARYNFPKSSLGVCSAITASKDITYVEQHRTRNPGRACGLFKASTCVFSVTISAMAQLTFTCFLVPSLPSTSNHPHHLLRRLAVLWSPQQDHSHIFIRWTIVVLLQNGF